MRGEDNNEDYLSLRRATMIQLQRLLEESDPYIMFVLCRAIDTYHRHTDIDNLARYSEEMMKKGHYGQRGDAVCVSVFLERTIIIVSDNLDDALNVIGERADIYNPDCGRFVNFYRSIELIF